MKMPTSFRPGVRAEFAQGGEQVGPMPQPGQPSSDSRSEGSVYTHGQTLLDRAKERLGFSKKGLSEQAQLKLIRIRQTASNTRGAVVKSRDDIEDLRESLVVLDRNISIQEQDVSRLREADRKDPVFLTTAREEAAIIRSEIDRLQKAMAANLEISSATQALFEALSRYVAQIKPGTLTHTGVVEPKLLAGESSGDAVNRLRRRLREMKSDLDYVRHAPWPSSEAKKLARSQVDALVERGRPNVFHLLDSRGDIAWPTETTQGMSRVFADGQQPHLIITTTSDALAIMAWLNRDAMVARLDAEIDSCSDDSKALTGDQRRIKSAEILSDMLASEREEEVLIERMEATGGTFLRRTNTDPRAVLGLSSEMPVPDGTHL